MSEPNEMNSARNELERALHSVTPAPVAVDAIAAAFDAGSRRQRRVIRLWQSASVLMLFAGIATGWIPRTSPTRGPSGKLSPLLVDLSTRPVQETDSNVRPVSSQSLLMLQRAVRERGIDGLRGPTPPPIRVLHMDDSI